MVGRRRRTIAVCNSEAIEDHDYEASRCSTETKGSAVEEDAVDVHRMPEFLNSPPSSNSSALPHIHMDPTGSTLCFVPLKGRLRKLTRRRPRPLARPALPCAWGRPQTPSKRGRRMDAATGGRSSPRRHFGR